MNSTGTKQEPPKSTSRMAKLWSRLSRSRGARERFVESHSAKAIAFQIRAMRRSRGWTQSDLAQATGMTQNMVSRLENPEYGRSSVTTLRRIAAAFDVALAVRFVPFSELAGWVATLSSSRMNVRPFDQDAIRRPVVSEGVDVRMRDTTSGYQSVGAVPRGRHSTANLVGTAPAHGHSAKTLDSGTVAETPFRWTSRSRKVS